MNNQPFTHDDAQALLDRLIRSGIKLGLDNIRKLLDLLDNPQNKFASVHVAGTNGKGSVCVMMAGALQHAGLKTGFFSSPHLVSIRERFRVNGQAISEEQFTSGPKT